MCGFTNEVGLGSEETKNLYPDHVKGNFLKLQFCNLAHFCRWYRLIFIAKVATYHLDLGRKY